MLILCYVFSSSWSTLGRLPIHVRSLIRGSTSWLKEKKSPSLISQDCKKRNETVSFSTGGCRGSGYLPSLIQHVVDGSVAKPSALLWLVWYIQYHESDEYSLEKRKKKKRFFFSFYNDPIALVTLACKDGEILEILQSIPKNKVQVVSYFAEKGRPSPGCDGMAVLALQTSMSSNRSCNRNFNVLERSFLSALWWV